MKLKNVFVILILCISQQSFAQEAFETLFWTSPNLVFDDQSFTMNFHFQTDSHAGSIYTVAVAPNSTDINSGSTRLLVSRQIPAAQSTHGSSMGRAKISFPALSAGSYEVIIDHENTDTSETFSFSVLDKQHRGFRKINHESPAAGELVSGVGLIRGWACQEQGDIGEVLFQIDDQDILSGSKQLKIPYGSERADTAEACSQTSESPSKSLNGYGAIINWNALSAGEHRFRLWVDGHLATDHMFSVAETKAEFQKGLSREVSVSDFPNNGDSSLLQWSEADQNFILIETQKAE